MGTSDVKAIIEQVEQLLAEEELSEQAEFAIHNIAVRNPNATIATYGCFQSRGSTKPVVAYPGAMKTSG